MLHLIGSVSIRFEKAACAISSLQNNTRLVNKKGIVCATMRKGGWRGYYLVMHSNDGEDLGYN